MYAFVIMLINTYKIDRCKIQLGSGLENFIHFYNLSVLQYHFMHSNNPCGSFNFPPLISPDGQKPHDLQVINTLVQVLWVIDKRQIRETEGTQEESEGVGERRIGSGTGGKWEHRREREEERRMDQGGGRDRKTDRRCWRGRKTDELLGEKTRGRGKGKGRWKAREWEQMMTTGREVKQIWWEEERKEQWMRRVAHIWRGQLLAPWVENWGGEEEGKRKNEWSFFLCQGQGENYSVSVCVWVRAFGKQQHVSLASVSMEI